MNISCKIYGKGGGINTKVYNLNPVQMQQLADILGTQLVKPDVLKGPHDTMRIKEIVIKNNI